MMYFGMALLLPLIWFLPWWSVAAAAGWLGWISGPRLGNALKFSSAAGIVSFALAFIKDGRNGGLISPRVAGLFGLPFSGAAFLMVFVLAFVTAFLCFQAGAWLSTLYKAKAVSLKSPVSN
jgi:hypothetical protein